MATCVLISPSQNQLIIEAIFVVLVIQVLFVDLSFQLEEISMQIECENFDLTTRIKFDQAYIYSILNFLVQKFPILLKLINNINTLMGALLF